MTRALLAGVFAIALAFPAYADVTVKQTITATGMGMLNTAPMTSYIKGSRMRTETTLGDRTQVVIIDLDTQKLYVVNSTTKEADVHELAAFSQQVGASLDMPKMKMSFKPNGQTKQIAGKTATGYDIEMSVPTSFGANKDMAMLMTMAGSVWMVKDVAGVEDFARFHKLAGEKGWFFSNPLALGQPGQTKAISEMYKQFAEAGGIAYEMEMQLKVDAPSGPLADVMAKMGNMSFAMKLDSIDTTPLADDLFAVPDGYKLNLKK